MSEEEEYKTLGTDITEYDTDYVAPSKFNKNWLYIGIAVVVIIILAILVI